MADAYLQTIDGAQDFYCRQCADKHFATIEQPQPETDPDWDFDQPEPILFDDIFDHIECASDSPQNCNFCHRPLGNTLTADGVEYVLDAIRESLRVGRASRNMVHACYAGTYYDGSRHCEIVRDWATELKSYFLDPADERLVNRYLNWTRK